MPTSRPRRCREKAWEQLQDYYHGVKCPQANVGAPEYLSIDGHKECLGENHGDDYSSVCLPEVKLFTCQVYLNLKIRIDAYYLKWGY